MIKCIDVYYEWCGLMYNAMPLSKTLNGNRMNEKSNRNDTSATRDCNMKMKICTEKNSGIALECEKSHLVII